MPSARTFYRTVVTVEVLSEEFPNDGQDRSEVARAITDGADPGTVLTVVTEPIDGSRAAALLEAQGSAPEFFGLDASGADVDA